MKGRTPTVKEREWMDRARELGCIACIKAGRIIPFEVPPEYTAIHHIDGKTKPGAHFLTIPLCPDDHQTGKNARHKNRVRFEERNGSEESLLELTKGYVYA
jgi:hypothetical protein